jgi:hypothetical protein
LGPLESNFHKRLRVRTRDKNSSIDLENVSKKLPFSKQVSRWLLRPASRYKLAICSKLVVHKRTIPIHKKLNPVALQHMAQQQFCFETR